MMTSTPGIDLQTLSSLLAGLDIDSNVFIERPSMETAHVRPPLQSSLSLPLDAHCDVYKNSAEPADGALMSFRLPAPRVMTERRPQSIGGESTSLYQTIDHSTLDTSKQSSTGAVTAPTRYKTELCRPYEENGACRYGSKCQFAHGKAELRSVIRHPKYKTDLCRTFHTTGLCPYGPRCHFIHNDEERRSSTSTDSSTSDQPLSVTQNQVEKRRLQRHYSDCVPRASTSNDPRHLPTTSTLPGITSSRVGGPGAGGGAVDLQRRSSSVADAVIRHSIGVGGGYHQRQLQTVLEAAAVSADHQPVLHNITSPHYSLADRQSVQSVGALYTSSPGSSSASSLTGDSRSPSPTLLLPPPQSYAVADCVPPTPPIRPPPSAATWSEDMDGEQARTALIAAKLLVARLGPQNLAAVLQALQLSGAGGMGNSLNASTIESTVKPGSVGLPRGVDRQDVWSPHQYPPHQHHYQQQQHGSACW